MPATTLYFREDRWLYRLILKKWRKCMGIEPTRQLVTGTLVLKFKTAGFQTFHNIKVLSVLSVGYVTF